MGQDLILDWNSDYIYFLFGEFFIVGYLESQSDFEKCCTLERS